MIFHIRSRARSASVSKLIGFLAIGDAMQTNTWTGFINNTAAAVGAHIPDAIRADTKEVDGSAGGRSSARSRRRSSRWVTDGRVASAGAAGRAAVDQGSTRRRRPPASTSTRSKRT